MHLPPNFTHSGPPPLRGRGNAFPLVFPDESPFRTPEGQGSLGVGRRSGCVFQHQGRTLSRTKGPTSSSGSL